MCTAADTVTIGVLNLCYTKNNCFKQMTHNQKFMCLKIATNDALLGCATRRAAMDASAKINFFSKLSKDAPRLPIQWTAVEPEKKRARRGPGQPRKLCEPVIANTENDYNGLGATGDSGDVAEEQPSSNTSHIFNVSMLTWQTIIIL